ncbi:MAG: ribosome small subunit-dependent GTPase A [Clostridiales bacterium]|jgi:ribosome biogenesis GTPase|nr:ribosome small subunit-dependent GTPase A [Clostridiales bacterium]
MEKGIIIKGIGGFYEVILGDDIIRCTLRGKFRKDGITPMVGDRVEVNTKDEVIEAVLPRKNQFRRPLVSNIDYLGIVVSVKKPQPDLLLVDKLMLSAAVNSVKSMIIINKIDLAKSWAEIEYIKEEYKLSGCTVLCISCKDGTGIDELMNELGRGITVFAGQSGVGKSSLINRLHPYESQKVGDISAKAERGRHTTRSVELLVLPDGRMIVDTPGFSALGVDFTSPQEVQSYYNEFIPYISECKYLGCMHYKEPDCGVKQAVEQGKLPAGRYERYIRIVEMIDEERRGQRW